MRGIATESAEQIAFVQYVRLKHPQLYEYLFSIPNGANKGRMSARKFQLEGLKSGVPDLFLARPMHDKAGLFIEMKRRRDSRTSEEQRAWIDRLNRMGYVAAVAKGADEAIRILEAYLNQEDPPP